MATVQDIANGLLSLTNAQLLSKEDIFNNLEQTQIKIGKDAGQTQANNSIVINATGSVLNNTTAQSFVVKPVRPTDVGSYLLTYNDTNGEVSKSTISQVQTAIGAVTEAQLNLKANASNPILTGQVSIAHTNNIGSLDTMRIDRTISSQDDARLILFQRNGVSTGVISNTATSTSYSTTSDYRLKNVISSITDASIRLLALKPIRFSWKSTGEQVDGFLAHEAQEVVPEAVNGVKDAIDADGNPEYQGIDQAKIVPLLVASLQDALKSIEALKQRMEILEARL